MPMILSPDSGLYAVSRSTYRINASFRDDLGGPVAPSSATWTLTDGMDIVINGRSAISISSLATTVSIVLSGDDIDYADSPHRVLTISALYDSTLGSNKSLVDSIRFPIMDTESGRIGV